MASEIILCFPADPRPGSARSQGRDVGSFPRSAPTSADRDFETRGVATARRQIETRSPYTSAASYRSPAREPLRRLRNRRVSPIPPSEFPNLAHGAPRNAALNFDGPLQLHSRKVSQALSESSFEFEE